MVTNQKKTRRGQRAKEAIEVESLTERHITCVTNACIHNVKQRDCGDLQVSVAAPEGTALERLLWCAVWSHKIVTRRKDTLSRACWRNQNVLLASLQGGRKI